MMHLLPFFLLVLITNTAASFNSGECLSDNETSAIISGYTDLITNTQANFNLTLAKKLLASDYQSSSAGVDYVRQRPLGSITFTSRAQFISQQVSDAPFPSVATLDIYHTCNVITWRYQLNTLPLPIRGITIFIVNNTATGKQIQTAYYELNTGALLYNLGKPECQANWTVEA